MHGAEGVGDVQLRHGGKLPGKLRVVLLLPGVKAQILQQHDLAALQGRRLGLGVLAHDVLGEDDLLAQQLAQMLRHRAEGQAVLPLALGLAQVGAGDHRRPTLQQIPDGGKAGHDALVAGDRARFLVLGHVEVAAQQDLLACHVHVHDGFLIVIHIGRSFMKIIRGINRPFRRSAAGRGSPAGAEPHRSAPPRSC